jgi:ABC-2 type transport system permease protein
MKLALSAEWTKLRTVPGPGWLLVAAAAVTVALSAAAAGALSCPNGLLDCGVDAPRVNLTGVQLGQAVIAVLAVLVVGEEYSTGLIRTTLTAMPARLRVLGAKAVTLTGLVLVSGTVGVVGSLVAGRLLLPFPVSLTAASTVRAGFGSVLYLALIGLLSLGLATALRDSALSIGVVLALLYLFPILAQVIRDPHWVRRIEQAAPSSAGLAVQATRDLSSLPIGPWAGLGVLALWATGALLLGGLLLRLRDA